MRYWFSKSLDWKRRKNLAFFKVVPRILPMFSESLATFTSGQVFDDGIIDPRDSRTVLGMALSAALSGEVKGAEAYGVFRM